MILVRFRHLNGNLKLAGSDYGIVLWVCAMGAYDTGWIGAMGLIYRDVMGARLDLGDEIDLWGCAMGSATQAGSGWWDWFMGHTMGARDWIGAMEVICGGAMGRTTLARSGRSDGFIGARHGAHDTGWIGAIGLIQGGVPYDKVLYGCWN